MHPILSSDGPPAPGTDPAGREWGVHAVADAWNVRIGDFSGDGVWDIFSLVTEVDEDGFAAECESYLLPGWGMDFNAMP